MSGHWVDLNIPTRIQHKIIQSTTETYCNDFVYIKWMRGTLRKMAGKSTCLRWPNEDKSGLLTKTSRHFPPSPFRKRNIFFFGVSRVSDSSITFCPISRAP